MRATEEIRSELRAIEEVLGPALRLLEADVGGSGNAISDPEIILRGVPRLANSVDRQGFTLVQSPPLEKSSILLVLNSCSWKGSPPPRVGSTGVQFGANLISPGVG